LAPWAAAPSTCCKRNQQEIQRRAGRGIEITMVADLDVARAQGRRRSPTSRWWTMRAPVIANPDIDIVIELIGGYGIAKALVLEAIAAGKHVVTANKALAGRAWHRNFCRRIAPRA